MGDVGFDGGEPATWSRSSKLARALHQVRELNRKLLLRTGSLPKCIDRGRTILLLLLSSRGCASTAASRAVLATTNQITTRAQVATTTVASRTKHAGRAEGHGLVSAACCAQTAEIIASNLARGKVWRRSLLAIAARKVASIPTAKLGTTTTTTAVGLLAHAFHLGSLLIANSLMVKLVIILLCSERTFCNIPAPEFLEWFWDPSRHPWMPSRSSSNR